MMNCLLHISGGENSTERDPVIVGTAWRLPVTLTPLLRLGASRRFTFGVKKGEGEGVGG